DAEGNPSVCNPDPERGVCSYPFHDPDDKNFGGPHTVLATTTAIDGGKMDGYIQAYRDACHSGGGQHSCGDKTDPVPDVMGYSLRSHTPNYWASADTFVLQAHMFEPLTGPSLRSHLALVSGWAALCAVPHVAASCTNDDNPSPSSQPDFPWTDITYLLD